MSAEEALAQVAGDLGLQLLALFGSRARDQARPGSDWDLAYVASPMTDREQLRLRITSALASDDIDLVDLSRGSALVRMKVASEGRPIYEATGGVFETFAIDSRIAATSRGLRTGTSPTTMRP